MPGSPLDFMAELRDTISASGVDCATHVWPWADAAHGNLEFGPCRL